MLLIYVVLFILFCLFIQYHWKRRSLYSLSWSLHGGYSLPLIGDGYKLMCKNEDILENVLKKITNNYPSPIKFWLSLKLVIFFTEVNQVEKILLSSKFAQKNEIYRFLADYIGQGLITSSGAKWKRDHRSITRFLTNKQVERYFPCLLGKLERLTKTFEKEVNGPKFDLKKHIARFSADLVCDTIAGVRTELLENELDDFLKDISYIYVKIHERIAKVWLHSDFMYSLLGHRKETLVVYRRVHAFFEKALENMKKIHENETGLDEETSDKSLLNRLLYIRDAIPDFATDQEIIDQLFTFYAAAEDTTTILTCFCLKLFGMYPEIQNKVYTELLDVFGSTPREVTLGDFEKLRYLQMCVKDVMRLFPIAPFIVRTATDDVKIDKWVVPKGCSIVVSIFNVHRDPKLWEKPDEFYPEHFTPEAVAKRHPSAFLAFSAGPRICAGKPFGSMALYTILATLLLRFEFLSEGKLQDKKLKADITTRFKDNDYSVSVRHRKKTEF